MNKVELLSPAGNFDALKAAVSNGCDAVYLGGNAFGARAFSNNFNHEEMIEAIKYCHIRGVKVYVTMNTLLFEKEIEPALKEVDFLYENDVDALLVQDLGLMYLIRQHYPDLELHASTQMHVHNVQGVEFAKKMGLKRAVLARETSIETIKECCKHGIDIEVFAYGALCICYSGECLMSALTQNRSGNRGMCAQCCRLPYDLVDVDSNQDVATKGNYLLSPKDLNLIDHIPELIEAGVTSLKIEGRMKRSEYVALVTRTFREAIDAYYNHQEYVLTPERLKELKLLFCREFTEGYTFHENGAQLMNPIRPNHLGVQIGTVIKATSDEVTIKLTDNLHQEDGLRLISSENEDVGVNANLIEKDGLLVNSAQSGDIVVLPVKDYVEVGAKVLKTTDSILLNEINSFTKSHEVYEKVDLKGKFEAKPGETFELIVTDGVHTVNAYSDINVEQAQKAPVDYERIVAAIAKCGDTPYHFTGIEGDADNIFIPIKTLNEVRRNALQQLSNLRETNHERESKKQYHKPKLSSGISVNTLIEVNNSAQVEALSGVRAYLFSTNSELNNLYEQVYTLMPSANEHSITNLTSPIMISEVGNLNQGFDEMYAGASLNVCNSYTLEMLMTLGVTGAVASYELDQTKIDWLLEGFRKRHDFEAPLYVMSQGRRDLMITKADLLYDGLASKSLKESHYGLRNYNGNIFKLFVDSDKITHIVEQDVFEGPTYPLRFIRLTDEEPDELTTIGGR